MAGPYDHKTSNLLDALGLPQETLEDIVEFLDSAVNQGKVRRVSVALEVVENSGSELRAKLATAFFIGETFTVRRLMDILAKHVGPHKAVKIAQDAGLDVRMRKVEDGGFPEDPEDVEEGESSSAEDDWHEKILGQDRQPPTVTLSKKVVQEAMGRAEATRKLKEAQKDAEDLKRKSKTQLTIQ